MKTVMLTVLLVGLSFEVSQGGQDRKSSGQLEFQPAVRTNFQQRIQDKSTLIEQKSQEWTTGTFTSVIDTNFDAELERHLHTALTPKTLQALKEFFHSLHENSFESYLHYRTNGARWTLDFGGAIGETIDYHTRKGAVFPNEAMAKARKVWELLSQAGNSKVIPQVLSVDLDAIQVSIERSKKPEIELGLVALKNLNNLSATTKNELIRYEETPQKIIHRDGAYDLLICTAIVRFNTSAKPGYVMAAFYWSEQDQRWLAWQLATDASSHFRRLF